MIWSWESFECSYEMGKLFGRLIITTRWWFQIFVIFTPIWGRFPFWLIFFKWVETTNQTITNIFRHHSQDMLWWLCALWACICVHGILLPEAGRKFTKGGSQWSCVYVPTIECVLLFYCSLCMYFIYMIYCCICIFYIMPVYSFKKTLDD